MKVKQNLSNVKSVLRKKLRGKAGKSKNASQSVAATVAAEAPRKGVRRLEQLEEQIDESGVLARDFSLPADSTARGYGTANITVLDARFPSLSFASI